MSLPQSGGSQQISLKYAFGLNTSIRNNLFCQEEDKIIYPAGYNIVQQNTSDNTQVFYSGVVDYRGISCMQLSSLRRWLAVGLKGSKNSEDVFEQPAIALYDTITQRKKFILTFREERIRYWVSLAFPAAQQESKFLVSLSNNFLGDRAKDRTENNKDRNSVNLPNMEKPEGEVIVCYWSLAGNGSLLAWMPLAQSPIDAFEVSLNQFDANLLTCIGKKIFRCYRCQEENTDGESSRTISSLKLESDQIKNLPVDLREYSDYSCHTWLSCANQLAVCTFQGDIIICDERSNFSFVLANSPSKMNGSPHRIECLCITTRGFVAGGKDCSVFVYRCSHNVNNPYDNTHRFTFKGYSDLRDLLISGVSISPQSEEKLVCSLSNNMIYTIRLKKEGTIGTTLESEEPIEPVSLAYHVGQINGMDLCMRKPLVATCGKDKTIKVWNYEEKTQELSWLFNEEAYCIAFHPSGLHMVVGFNDKLRWMNVSLHQSANSNKNKYYKEIAQFKQCREVRFSNGGEYFAAINGSSSSQLIQIFRFFTGEQPPQLVFKGHTGRVRCLSWSSDDSLLASCGVDGMVYVWRLGSDVQDPRLYESCLKGVQLSCVALNWDNSVVFSCGSDKCLQVAKVLEGPQSMKKMSQDLMLSQLAFTSTNKLLLAGIADEARSAGNVRCIQVSGSFTGSSTDYAAHDELGIERMRVTYDDKYLITAGRDGCLFLFEIKDKDARGMRLIEGYKKFSEEILVTRPDLEDLKNTLENYKSMIGEFGSQMQLSNQTNQKDEQITKMQDKLAVSMDSNKNSLEMLAEKRKELDKRYEDELKATQEHFETQIQELDTSFQRKVMDEVEQHEKLRREKESERLNNNRERQAKQATGSQSMNQLDQEFLTSLQEERSQRERVQHEIEKMQRDNDEMYRQIQQESADEVRMLDERNNKQEGEVKEKSKKAKSEAAITTKKTEQKKRDAEQYEETTRAHNLTLRQLRDKNEEYLQLIADQRRTISEKDKQIGQQEKQIYKEKKKSQNLEKFKFVLDHKIKELKRDIVPREDEITRMKEETNEMDQLLNKYNSYNNHLGNAVDELYTAQELMGTQIKHQRQKIASTNNRIKRFKDDLYTTVQFIQDPQKLSEHVQQLKNTHASKTEERAKSDEQIQSEYENQKQHLKFKVQRLKKYLKQDNQIHKDYNLGLMSNNVNLIKEINVLRKQIKEIQKGEGLNMSSILSGLPPPENARSKSLPKQRNRSISTGARRENTEDYSSGEANQKENIIMQQSEAIAELRVALEELLAENQELEQMRYQQEEM